MVYMDIFLGHWGCGAVIALVGLWWIVQTLRRYNDSKQKGIPFKATPTFKCNCLCGRLKTYEIEGLIKAVMLTVLFIIGILTSFKDGKYFYYVNGQHCTVMLAFAMSGVVDVLRHHKFPIPEEASYAMLAFSVGIEGVLVQYHQHERNEIEILTHTLLVYTIFCNFLAVLAEFRYRNSFMAAISRGYFFLLQGIWLICVGFILGNPYKKADWDPKNHDHMMLVTMLFAWHILGAVLIILILNCAVAVKYRKGLLMQSLETPYHKMINDGHESRGLLDNKADGHAIDLKDVDDFDSEPAYLPD